MSRTARAEAAGWIYMPARTQILGGVERSGSILREVPRLRSLGARRTGEHVRRRSYSHRYLP